MTLRIHPSSRVIARRLRATMTDAELALWRQIRHGQLSEFKFRRQQPIAGAIVDFVCLEAGLVIEVDGGQHSNQIAEDKARTRSLEQAGFRVLRFWNHEVLTDMEAVKTSIWHALAHPHPDLPPQGGRNDTNSPLIPSPSEGEGQGGGGSMHTYGHSPMPLSYPQGNRHEQ